MNRRTFLKNSAITAICTSTFGRIGRTESAYTGDTPTTSDILGPFYRPGAPFRSNLIPPKVTGEILNIGGTVFGYDGRSKLSGVSIESWQCDPGKVYDNTSDDYLYRGILKTGDDGSYQFRTLVPPPYKDGESWRPAHIHYRFSAPDFQDLITQVYFQGDPHLSGDASSSSPQAAHRILNIEKEQNGELAVRFDIAMQKSLPLDNSAYSKITGLYQLKSGMAEFYRIDDLLYLKMNGQIMEGMVHKGGNSFSGAMGANRAEFEFTPEGKVNCKIILWDFENDKQWLENHSGSKFIKYGN